MATLRNLAISILRLAGRASIARNPERAFRLRTDASNGK
jgi:hypothetical protein